MHSIGGEFKERHTIPDQDGGIILRWMPDGKNLIYLQKEGAGKSLWRIPVDNDNTIKLCEIPFTINDFVIHPNGKKIALEVSGEKGRYSSELWVMENFLPKD